ncbi:MAG: RHS repeat-associated core domain-containing protein [Streptosporangiaceae bacterium]
MSQGTWNGAGQLTAYDNTAANMTAGAYDGNGLRASTTITPSGGSALTQGYVWSTGPAVPELIMDGTNAHIYDAARVPAEQVNISTGTISYLVADAIGSVRGAVNSSGSLTGTMSYDAWGNPARTGGLTATSPFGFAGGYTDPDGLIYLINRYLQPSTGQFISVDPAISQTLQPYAYTGGNPVSNSDPTGMGQWISFGRWLTLPICIGAGWWMVKHPYFKYFFCQPVWMGWSFFKLIMWRLWLYWVIMVGRL